MGAGPVQVRSLLAVILIASLCVVAYAQDSKISKAEAERFKNKLAQIESTGVSPARRPGSHTTTITDVEVNSYLRYLAGSEVPAGISAPILHAEGNGRVTGRAIVDLDAVRTQKQRAWTDPLGYLTGQLPITAAGTLTTSNGVGRFQLESAQVSGVTVPKSLLQELLSYYSRSADRPAGINMDDPFQLSSAIREIRIDKGSATIVQ
jgi:hypothetical protein